MSPGRESDPFLAFVAHELRTPLNGIKTWAHVLENLTAQSPAAVKRALAGILLGVEQQARLIDDLLGGSPRRDIHTPYEENAMPDKEKHNAEPEGRDAHPNEGDQRRNRTEEHPDRPHPDTLKGPGSKHQAEESSTDKTTRRGEG